MMRISTLTFAAITALSPIYAFGQTTPATTTVPLTKTLPSTATVAQTPGITLRSLPAVLDARERRQDWHTAAEQAGNRIQDPGLKSQFNQRLAGVVPTVAKLLIAHPQEYALVTVGVYRGKDMPDKQAMVAVTLAGTDTQLGSDFFADVVAGLPQIPSGEGLPTGLTLDTEATSYLLFFLGEKQLEAGDIPHPTFGKSIMLATNKVQKDAEAQAVASANAERARAAAAQERIAGAQARANANQSNAPTNTDGPATGGYVEGQQAGYAAPGNPYGYAYNYPLVNDGYYYPGVGVPIVILPGEAESTPQIQQRQIERQHRLEQAYRARAGASGNGNPQGSTQTPITGQSGAPQAGGAVTQRPPAQNQRPNPTAPNVSPSQTTPGNPNVHQGETTPRSFPQPGQPGGAPVGSNAPAAPAPSSSGSGGTSGGGAPHPAPGAPGGAPAGGAKK